MPLMNPALHAIIVAHRAGGGALVMTPDEERAINALDLSAVANLQAVETALNGFVIAPGGVARVLAANWATGLVELVPAGGNPSAAATVACAASVPPVAVTGPQLLSAIKTGSVLAKIHPVMNNILGPRGDNLEHATPNSIAAFNAWVDELKNRRQLPTVADFDEQVRLLRNGNPALPGHWSGAVIAAPSLQVQLSNNNSDAIKRMKTTAVLIKLLSVDRDITNILNTLLVDLSNADEASIKEFVKWLDSLKTLDGLPSPADFDRELAKLRNAAPLKDCAGVDLNNFETTPGDLNATAIKQIKTNAVLRGIKDPYVRELLTRRRDDLRTATQASLDRFNTDLGTLTLPPPALPNALRTSQQIDDAVQNLRNGAPFQTCGGVNDLVGQTFAAFAGGNGQFALTADGDLGLKKIRTNAVLEKIKDPIIREKMRTHLYNLSAATDSPNGGTIKTFNDAVKNLANHAPVDLNTRLDALVVALNGAAAPRTLAAAPAPVQLFNGAAAALTGAPHGGELAKSKSLAVRENLGIPWKDILDGYNFGDAGVDIARVNVFKKHVENNRNLNPFNVAGLNAEVNTLATGVANTPAQKFGPPPGDAPSLASLVNTNNLHKAQTRAVWASIGDPWKTILEERQYDVSDASPQRVENFKKWITTPANLVGDFLTKLDRQLNILATGHRDNAVQLLPGATVALETFADIDAPLVLGDKLERVQTHAVLTVIGEPWLTILSHPTRQFNLNGAADHPERIKEFKRWVNDISNYPLGGAALDTQLAILANGTPLPLAGVLPTAVAPGAPLPPATGRVFVALQPNSQVLTAIELRQAKTQAVLTKIDAPWAKFLQGRNYDLSGATPQTIADFKVFVSNSAHFPDPMTPVAWGALNTAVQALAGNRGVAVPQLGANPIIAFAAANFPDANLTIVRNHAKRMVSYDKVLPPLRNLLRTSDNAPTLSGAQVERINKVLVRRAGPGTKIEVLDRDLHFEGGLPLEFLQNIAKQKPHAERLAFWANPVIGFLPALVAVASYEKIEHKLLRKAFQEARGGDPRLVLPELQEAQVQTFSNQLHIYCAAHPLATLAEIDVELNRIATTVLVPPIPWPAGDFLGVAGGANPSPLAQKLGITAASFNAEQTRLAHLATPGFALARHAHLQSILNKRTDDAQHLSAAQVEWLSAWLTHFPQMTREELNFLLQDPIRPLNGAANPDAAVVVLATIARANLVHDPIRGRLAHHVPVVVPNQLPANFLSYEEFEEVKIGLRMSHFLYRPATDQTEVAKGKVLAEEYLKGFDNFVDSMKHKPMGRFSMFSAWVSGKPTTNNHEQVKANVTATVAALLDADPLHPNTLKLGVYVDHKPEFLNSLRLEYNLLRADYEQRIQELDNALTKLNALKVALGGDKSRDVLAREIAVKSNLPPFPLPASCEAQADKIIALRDQITARETAISTLRSEYVDITTQLKRLSAALSKRSEELVTNEDAGVSRPAMHASDVAAGALQEENFIQADGSLGLIIPDSEVMEALIRMNIIDRPLPGAKMELPHAGQYKSRRDPEIPQGHSRIYRAPATAPGTFNYHIVMNGGERRIDIPHKSTLTNQTDLVATEQRAAHRRVASAPDDVVVLSATGNKKRDEAAYKAAYIELLRAGIKDPRTRILNFTSYNPRDNDFDFRAGFSVALACIGAIILTAATIGLATGVAVDIVKGTARESSEAAAARDIKELRKRTPQADPENLSAENSLSSDKAKSLRQGPEGPPPMPIPRITPMR